ncbi:dicarboxylate/amino acid:cation symporter [Malaciobacter molluscorum LMG 25693]|uniref:Dicarboxylate/amino acid:cation symporter n=1 Tax=Malaciobacter molluscorum LMG 25693 TaxID=870501 RepID=A0A2G1DGA7_9BACT|nr:dicarboxylate/amino acid:cation symporter [Malaciobacter molluscorum]AXX93463.1 sodium:dicarboxylate symporter, SDF family [Malaciobacter molluscorum LMG 25693]PHO17523.1 dicarboxylate/amino acid:cation symporter [Malaciobacter molluscorum LMG 25693]RXJ93303.1 dicarboxylate/amino acid:cation symporter [Malaciobacter molluscorum]
MWALYKKVPLWQKIFLGLVLGLITGLIFKDFAIYLKPLGTLFLNLIKMLIVPLIFVTLVSGITSMDDLSKMKRVGLKTFFIYLATTAVAITIGLAFGYIFQPGVGIELTNEETVIAKTAPSLIDTLLNIITTNPISSLAQGNILQIIFFAIILGLSINLAKDKSKPLKDFFSSFSEVMFKMTDIVISFAPIGIFGLMAWVSASYGIDVLYSLLKVILCVYIASLLHMIFTYGLSIKFISKLSMIKFFKGIIPAQMIAFTTTSSSGTLPVTTSNVVNNLGASKSISSFVLPLGATINMDGTAIYQGVCAMFVAQAFGVDLTFSNMLTIVLTSTLASIGTAGVPGAGLIMLTLVLTSVNLPLEGVAIIAGIDRILDMARTTVNVTGDAMVSVFVAKSENELDEKVYNS